MSTIWRKAIRDFWRERARTVLVVLAIALGISAFAAVMSSYTILTRELDLGYLATNPASAVMRLDSIDDETIKAILQNPEVSDAEPRRTIRGQMKAGPVQWRNLMLFVVHDYGNIRVSKLVPEEGAWPPANGEILIERDAFQVAKAKIGDVVRVKTANGVEQPLVITGSAHDVGQAQARMENIVYGYINLATLVQLGEEPTLDQLNILVAQNRFDENHIRRVVADVEKTINSRGHQVRRIDIPAPGKHPHSDLTGILLLGDVELRPVCARAQRNSRDQLAHGDDGFSGAPDRSDESYWRNALADSADLFRAGVVSRDCGSDRFGAAGNTRQSCVVPLHGGVSQFRHQQFRGTGMGLFARRSGWPCSTADCCGLPGLEWDSRACACCAFGFWVVANYLWSECVRSSSDANRRDFQTSCFRDPQ